MQIGATGGQKARARQRELRGDDLVLVLSFATIFAMLVTVAVLPYSPRDKI